MGRGTGGYTERQTVYEDSGGKKVTDKGAIFVAERYIDLGYEAVFRREHETEKSLDLTIKTSDDRDIIKNIEVKQVTSSNSSKIASNMKKAYNQINDGDTVAIYLPKFKNNSDGIAFAMSGIKEAERKGYIRGPVEVWFSDKTSMTYEGEH